MTKALLNTDLPDIKLFKKGKVRDVYAIGDKLLIVATDRISAFDVIMPNGIPDKGKILTQISTFWFDFTKTIIKNHIIATGFDEMVSIEPNLAKYKSQIEGRSMLVKKTAPLTIECVVRGYLAGSGWKEYKQSGAVCGIKLPKGLKESDKLPKPIFTPSTKAEAGHDENITPEKAADSIGKDIFETISEKSIEIYKKASDYALTKGIIIADTKFEFGKLNAVIASSGETRGKQSHNEIILIDEVLTPDSSRFWPKDEYSPGKGQPSFDKQFVRDYLETLDWNKTPPGPQLPEDVARKTQEKYRQALAMLTS
ncbi:MAG: phosphoribosylaminoimidazolesuccinocarboxamide synthase [Candidatus Omnitrophica bacterium]|nr:phosphoribosylaminoimidazolesuccinocarboxamide synthase [Candidatus Omnitrophota bacterium]